jgi:hypothetical protein
MTTREVAFIAEFSSTEPNVGNSDNRSTGNKTEIDNNDYKLETLMITTFKCFFFFFEKYMQLRVLNCLPLDRILMAPRTVVKRALLKHSKGHVLGLTVSAGTNSTGKSL